MKKVVIYSGPNCSYCERAKNMLRKKAVVFEEINVRDDPQKLAEMMQKSGGRRSVPQIFIGDLHVGGSDDLQALNASGKLEGLLKF